MQTNLNIPIYRAKRIDSDEYVIGWLIQTNVFYFIVMCGNDYMPTILHNEEFIEIDPSTLAISFPDMLDSEGNQIFASLSEDGRGGGILQYQADSGTCLSCNEDLPKTEVVAIYEDMQFKEIALNEHKCFNKREFNYTLKGNIEYKKVIGIQQ